MRIKQLCTGPLNVIRAEGRPFKELLHDTSANADIVFPGMAMPKE